MGIPHLITSLRPYAERKPLSGDACVDGPALAYHIYFVCLGMRAAVRNPFEAAPSYEEIGNAALAWLDGMQSSGVVIKQIYFDGYLPPSKLETRLGRLRAQTRRLDNLQHSSPVPCRLTMPPKSGHLNLYGSNATQPDLIGFPPPAFLVPAVLEALLASGRYGALTSVVPGEADMFCAEHLKNYGGIVFTGDSDLLIHDLGKNGSVAFLKDVESISDRKPYTLFALLYHAFSISNRLELPKADGLLGLGFEMTRDTHGTFKKLVAKAASRSSITAYPDEYEEFCKEYIMAPGIYMGVFGALPPEVAIRKALQSLDPRISEYVLQFPSLSKLAGYGKPISDTTRVFLPFLLGDPTRTHAWEMSTPTRQLAYGLNNLIVPQNECRANVVEHRRQQKDSGGRAWALPTLDTLQEACNSLVKLHDQLEQMLPGRSSNEVFLALAIYQEVEWCTSLDKRLFSQTFVKHFLEGQDHEAYRRKPCTWEIIQFLAQLQGSFYSFRMLRQILSILITHPSISLPEGIYLLHQRLQKLPPLTESPDLRCMAEIAKKIESMSMVKISYELLGMEDASAKPIPSKKKSKKKQGEGKLLAQAQTSSNPFGILDVANS